MGRAPDSRADWQRRLNIGGARRDVFHFTRGPGAAHREVSYDGYDGEYTPKFVRRTPLYEHSTKDTHKKRFPENIEGQHSSTSTPTSAPRGQGFIGGKTRIPGLSSSMCGEKERYFSPRSRSGSSAPFTSSYPAFSSSKKDRTDFADLLRVRPPSFLTSRAQRTGHGASSVPAHPRTFRNLREEQIEKQKQEINRILRAPTKNPWEILKLPQPNTIRDTSSDLAITRQFRLLSRLCHPDKVPRALNDQATKAFQILERAVQEARKFNQERESPF